MAAVWSRYTTLLSSDGNMRVKPELIIAEDSSMSAKKSTKDSKEQNTPLGGLVLAETPITFNENKPVTKVKVRNTGDRPIQVGSHFHFFEVNRALEFDRAAAYGKRLNISSTTAIRLNLVMKLKFRLSPLAASRHCMVLTILSMGGPVRVWYPTVSARINSRLSALPPSVVLNHLNNALFTEQIIEIRIRVMG